MDTQAATVGDTERPLLAPNRSSGAQRTLGDLVILYFSVITMLLIICTGVVGNVLVLMAIRGSRKLQTLSNAFIVNLSCCDLIFILGVLPFNIYTYINDGWFLSEFLCKLVGFFGYALTGTIMMNICIIAWNRYKLVTDMSGFKTSFCARNVTILIILTWILPVLLLVPSLLEIWGKFGYVAILVTCNLLIGHSSQSFKIMLLIARALIPLGLIGYCYMFIHRLTRRSQMCMEKRVTNLRTLRTHWLKHERHLTRTILAIILTFALSYFPCAVTSIIDWHHLLSQNYHMFCEITVYIGSAINPMIYGFMNTQFREAYMDIFSRMSGGSRKATQQGSVGATISSSTSIKYSPFKHLLSSECSATQVDGSQPDIVVIHPTQTLLNPYSSATV